MGFWAGVGKVFNDLGEQGKAYNEAKSRYESKSDHELMKLLEDDGFFGTDWHIRALAGFILINRGHSRNDIERKFGKKLPDILSIARAFAADKK